MKRIIILIATYFLSFTCFSQDCILIEHVGPTDYYIPELMIKTKKVNQKDDSIARIHRNNSFHKIQIELSENHYRTFKKLISNNEFLQDTLLPPIEFGNLGIMILKRNTKKIFFVSNTKSVLFLKWLVNWVKDKKFELKLISKLELLQKGIVQ